MWKMILSMKKLPSAPRIGVASFWLLCLLQMIFLWIRHPHCLTNLTSNACGSGGEHEPLMSLDYDSNHHSNPTTTPAPDSEQLHVPSSSIATPNNATDPDDTVATDDPIQLPFSYHLVAGKFSRNDSFVEEVLDFRDEAQTFDLFPTDNMFVYTDFPDFVLNDERFTEQHLAFLKNESHPSERGAGYWFWKPLLIQYHLRTMNEGDILVYLDVDNALCIYSIRTLVRVMQERGANLVLRQIPFLQREWTKRDIYDAYCKDVYEDGNPDLDELDQMEASQLVIRKTNGTVQFIDAWADMVADYHLVSDEESYAANIETFEENRHDQSLLNTLLNCGSRPRSTNVTGMDLCAEMELDNATVADDIKEDVCEFGQFFSFVVDGS